MKAKFGSVEVEGDPAEIAALITAMGQSFQHTSPVGAAQIGRKFVSEDVAFRALKRRGLSVHQVAVLRTLAANHSRWTTALELQKATKYNGNQLGGLFGAFGKRVASTEGYQEGSWFFDQEWNYDEDCYQYRLPESVRSAVLRAKL